MPEVAPGVGVAQSRFWSTNATWIRAASSCLLVDPGVYPDELAALVEALGRAPAAAVHTHAHWDHVLWCAALGLDTPRFVTDGTATFLRTHRRSLLADLREHRARWDEQLVGLGAPLDDGAAVPWPGPDALLVRTDAHVPGHGSLHLPELGLLVVGDLVSDVDVPFPFWATDPGDAAGGRRWPEGLAPYREGLDRVAALHPVGVVVPGHGTPTDGRGLRTRLDADRRYLDALEDVVARSASSDDAVRLAAGLDSRLRDLDVRAAHDSSVRALFAAAHRDR